jgi:hypothetical protein
MWRMPRRAWPRRRPPSHCGADGGGPAGERGPQGGPGGTAVGAGAWVSTQAQREEGTVGEWHQATDAYFDSDAFRVAIQSAIQTMRSVTFILQKNKAIIPDFDRWYADWQKTLIR